MNFESDDFEKGHTYLTQPYRHVHVTNYSRNSSSTCLILPFIHYSSLTHFPTIQFYKFPSLAVLFFFSFLHFIRFIVYLSFQKLSVPSCLQRNSFINYVVLLGDTLCDCSLAIRIFPL